MRQNCGMRHRRMAATFAVAIGGITLAGGARAEEENYVAPVADISTGNDSDGFHSLRLRLGALPFYENTWSHSGAVVQATRYSQGEFRKDVAAVLGIYRDQRRDTLAGVDVEAGVARVSGHLRPVGEMTLRLSTSLSTAVDLNVSADLVETPRALERGTAYTFVAASLEQRLSERFTFTGLAGWQQFTDGNARPHLRAADLACRAGRRYYVAAPLPAILVAGADCRRRILQSGGLPAMAGRRGHSQTLRGMDLQRCHWCRPGKLNRRWIASCVSGRSARGRTAWPRRETGGTGSI